MAFSLQIQPSTTGLTLARSPIIFKYTGCTQGNTYLFNLYLTGGTLGYNFNIAYDVIDLTTIYSSIERTPDTNNCVIVDASNLIYNYIKDNDYFYNNDTPITQRPVTQYIDDSGKTWAWFKANIIEYSGTTSGSTIMSNTCLAIMGYTTDIISNPINTTYGLPYYWYRVVVITGGPTYILAATGNTYPMKSILPDIVYDIDNTLVDNATIGCGSLSSLYFKIGYINRYDSRTGGPGTNHDETISVNYAGITKYYTLTNHLNSSDYGLPNTPLNIYRVPLPHYTTPGLITVSNTYNTYYFKYSNCNNLSSGIIYVKFLNKYGVWDFITFKGRADTELNTTSETFKNNTDPWNGMTYYKSNIQGKNKITVNTGWLNEHENITLEELFLSEFVYILKGYKSNNTAYPIFTSVILTDTNVKYKTDKWDRLINYALTFEEAVDKINNIM